MGETVELMNLYWTAAGISPGEGEISSRDFKDRVESAAKAGFKGIGLWHADLKNCLIQRSLKEMKAILDGNGMKYLELEFLTDWFLDGDSKLESNNRKKLLLQAAETLGAKHIKVGDFRNSNVPMGRLVESFSALCAEAENCGTAVGFEFMVGSLSGKFKDVVEMVKQAGAKNGGIIIDIVHIILLGMPYQELRQIPLQYLINVELNDGWLPGNPRRDPSGTRSFCGEGEYDIKGFIQTVKDMGYSGPWAVEVYSSDVAAMPLQVCNEKAYQTTMALFK